jgi:pyridoxal biosynthesis lyase PdxS
MLIPLPSQELYTYAKDLRAPFHLLKETARLKRLPVVLFAAGGIATPADAALMMQMGMDGVFVGSGIVRIFIPRFVSTHELIVGLCSSSLVIPL